MRFAPRRSLSPPCIIVFGRFAIPLYRGCRCIAQHHISGRDHWAPVQSKRFQAPQWLLLSAQAGRDCVARSKLADAVKRRSLPRFFRNRCSTFYSFFGAGIQLGQSDDLNNITFGCKVSLPYLQGTTWQKFELHLHAATRWQML